MVTQVYGGEHPSVNVATGLKLTVEPPDSLSTTTYVHQGDVLVLDPTDTAFDGVGLKTKWPAGGEDATAEILVQALSDIKDTALPLGVLILTKGVGIRVLKYDTDDAPAVGESIETSADGNGTVNGVAFAKDKGLVISVDTAAHTCEVLFP